MKELKLKFHPSVSITKLHALQIHTMPGQNPFFSSAIMPLLHAKGVLLAVKTQREKLEKNISFAWGFYLFEESGFTLISL